MLWRWYGSGVFLLHQFVDGALDLLRGAERVFPFAAAKIVSLFIRMGEKSGIVKKISISWCKSYKCRHILIHLGCLSGTLRSKSQNNMHYF